MLGSRPGDRRTMSVRLMAMRGQIQSYCTATTNPAVISHCQVCRSALSSVIAEAAGPSEAPEAGPALWRLSFFRSTPGHRPTCRGHFRVILCTRNLLTGLWQLVLDQLGFYRRCRKLSPPKLPANPAVISHQRICRAPHGRLSSTPLPGWSCRYSTSLPLSRKAECHSTIRHPGYL
jgi:hypothetical protein